MVWFKFLLCAGLIFVAGSILSKYADILAEKSGMGRTWIGLILLATVTSLPELATGVSSVTVADAPDIAAGDVLGSCVFNLMLIGLIDLFYKPAPVLSKVQQGNILSAGFGILLIGLASLGIVLGTQPRLWGGGWISPVTPMIFIVYYAAIRMVFQYEKKRMSEFIKTKAEAETEETGGVALSVVYRNIAINSGVIVAAGIWLPFIGNEIAEVTGWGTTFVGGFFIAASTSMPEIVTSFAALRLGALDLAVANLLGSNLFNIAVLGIDDLFYTQAPLLSDISVFHLFPALIAILMTGIAVVGLIFGIQKKAWLTLSWDGFALVACYFLSAYLIFQSAPTAGGIIDKLFK